MQIYVYVPSEKIARKGLRQLVLPVDEKQVEKSGKSRVWSHVDLKKSTNVEECTVHGV